MHEIQERVIEGSNRNFVEIIQKLHTNRFALVLKPRSQTKFSRATINRYAPWTNTTIWNKKPNAIILDIENHRKLAINLLYSDNAKRNCESHNFKSNSIISSSWQASSTKNMNPLFTTNRNIFCVNVTNFHGTAKRIFCCPYIFVLKLGVRACVIPFEMV